MASINGICKNCGSLIVTDDRDAMCECLFCDCVFPTLEAVEIANHPQDYTFPNEPQPKRDGVRRYTAVPVFPDPVPAAVKQSESLTPANAKQKEKNPYEVSADDVKAPAKTLWTIVGIAVAVVLIVAAGFLPFYLIRMSHRSALSASIDQVFSEAGYTVDTTKTDGYPVGYSITGQTNNKLKVVTMADEISPEQLSKTYEAFAALRAGEYGYSSSDSNRYYGGLAVEIIAGQGTFTIWSDDNPEETATAVIHFVPDSTEQSADA